MKKNIVINDMIIGEAMPKICTPLTGGTVEELLAECQLIQESKADLVEWRVDFFQDTDDINFVLNTLSKIKETLKEMPLLFSFRTRAEGGEKQITQEDYLALNKAVAASGYIDLIDIELFIGKKVVLELVEVAKENNVYTVVSNHDFDKTPTAEIIISIVEQALELGADLPKVAVMPQTEEDVLSVFEANLKLKRKYPTHSFIMIAMGRLGVVSRFSGEIFGSAITFASAKKASAPGQISIDKLTGILQLIHEAE